jgi:hypothetical protein
VIPAVATGQPEFETGRQEAIEAAEPFEFETGRQEAIEAAEPFEPRAGLGRDILDELRWTWAGRKGWLLGMFGNLVFAVGYLVVTDYDPHVAGDIKVANVGLAVVLWCLADTVNTNQLGNDSERVVNSLRPATACGGSSRSRTSRSRSSCIRWRSSSRSATC